ncbi:uncharacterized protein [Miscanthus floridulus]|uniref:uncharacterized protein n=1 Tax=Miscanthus floridulus TaxID=154761 RepID=UPI003458BA60
MRPSTEHRAEEEDSCSPAPWTWTVGACRPTGVGVRVGSAVGGVAEGMAAEEGAASSSSPQPATATETKIYLNGFCETPPLPRRPSSSAPSRLTAPSATSSASERSQTSRSASASTYKDERDILRLRATSCRDGKTPGTPQSRAGAAMLGRWRRPQPSRATYRDGKTPGTPQSKAGAAMLGRWRRPQPSRATYRDGKTSGTPRSQDGAATSLHAALIPAAADDATTTQDPRGSTRLDGLFDCHTPGRGGSPAT